MVNRPSVPEIITVNSEALQTQIRDLLPSQNGFGSELQASNVITPIIDLTATAEGSSLPTNLQTALAFGSQTAFNVANATTTLVNSPGFYRCYGVANDEAGGSNRTATFQLDDGLSQKIIWQMRRDASGVDHQFSLDFDFIVFLAAGESLVAVSNIATTVMTGSTRQIATGDGTLVQPSGFPL